VAVAQVDGPVGGCGDHWVVGDDEDRHLLAVPELAQKVEDQLNRGAVEAV
jgi:hypothetical protein